MKWIKKIRRSFLIALLSSVAGLLVVLLGILQGETSERTNDIFTKQLEIESMHLTLNIQESMQSARKENQNLALAGLRQVVKSLEQMRDERNVKRDKINQISINLTTAIVLLNICIIILSSKSSEVLSRPVAVICGAMGTISVLFLGYGLFDYASSIGF